MKTVILLLLSVLNLNAQAEFSLNNLNEAYYNIYDYNFNGFEADIELDLIEQLKTITTDETKLNILNNIKFNIKMFSIDSIVFTTEGAREIGTEDFDKGLKQIISGTEKVVKGALISWGESCLKHQLEFEENSYSVKIEKNITELNYTEARSSISVFISNSTLIDSIYLKNQNSDLKTYLEYQKTDIGKLILEKMRTNINNFIEMTFKIDYADFDKIKIPQRVKVSTKSKSYNQELTYTFKNITLM